ncbi:hypothetical protein Hokovirus_1_43 [Hokovirus HKV1]|uniref:Uncharacterized protein n=1 Tax=Hokovirus HKV1 TaxID=1977638 RepID=A0A1V0SEW1_9VIRU|nr:hypothetical protein Hokovirus_1_43 [Hokovirus HKV1]
MNQVPILYCSYVNRCSAHTHKGKLVDLYVWNDDNTLRYIISHCPPYGICFEGVYCKKQCNKNHLVFCGNKNCAKCKNKTCNYFLHESVFVDGKPRTSQNISWK